jgi:universal stress protein A
MTPKHILVPTDFSPQADAALRYALDLAAVLDARVHLVHVVEDPVAAGMWSAEFYTVTVAGLQISLVKDSEQHLRRIVAESGIATGALTSEVRTGPAARVIVDAAAERGDDLIVMGTTGRTGLAHVVMGSVAEKVVRLAHCPVLTIGSGTSRPPAESRSARSMVIV